MMLKFFLMKILKVKDVTKYIAKLEQHTAKIHDLEWYASKNTDTLEEIRDLLMEIAKEGIKP
jgi:large-conductance mechanosensitive channel